MTLFFLLWHGSVVLFNLSYSVLLRFFVQDKQYKKHLKRRKKIFFFFVPFSIAFFWLYLEEAFSSTTILVLSILEMIIFFGFLSWSIFSFVKDQKRIAFAQKRRNG